MMYHTVRLHKNVLRYLIWCFLKLILHWTSSLKGSFPFLSLPMRIGHFKLAGLFWRVTFHSSSRNWLFISLPALVRHVDRALTHFLFGMNKQYTHGFRTVALMWALYTCLADNKSETIAWTHVAERRINRPRLSVQEAYLILISRWGCRVSSCCWACSRLGRGTRAYVNPSWVYFNSKKWTPAIPGGMVVHPHSNRCLGHTVSKTKQVKIFTVFCIAGVICWLEVARSHTTPLTWIVSP